jgi:hypothetical protein
MVVAIFLMPRLQHWVRLLDQVETPMPLATRTWLATSTQVQVVGETLGQVVETVGLVHQRSITQCTPLTILVPGVVVVRPPGALHRLVAAVNSL